jgi:hypothetical protein
LRQYLLEKDGAFACIDAADEAMFPAETPLFNINATVNSIKVHGLDRAVVLSPLSVIGHSTLQTDVYWESLTVETNITVEIRGNSLDGSFFDNGHELAPLVETILAVAKVDSINATISAMVPLKAEDVELIPLGLIMGLLPLNCIPPVLSNIAVSGINVTIGNLNEPTLKGSSSQEIKKMVKDGASIGLQLFESSMLEAGPVVFQTKIREAINANLADYHCPVVERRKLTELLTFR